MHRPHVQLAIDDAQQDRVAICEPERAPDVRRNLQATPAHQFATLRIHVAYPTFIQMKALYTFFVILAILAAWTNSAKRFYARQLEVAGEGLDGCADVVREFVHQIEPFGVMVILGDQPQLAVHKGANDAVLVRVMEPNRFGDVARPSPSRIPGRRAQVTVAIRSFSGRRRNAIAG